MAKFFLGGVLGVVRKSGGVHFFAFFRFLLHFYVTIFRSLSPSPLCASMERAVKYSQTLKENGILVIKASPGWVWGKARASLVSSEKGKAQKALHKSRGWSQANP